MTYMFEQTADSFVCAMGIGGTTVHVKGLPAGKGCIGRRCSAWRWETIVDEWDDKKNEWNIRRSNEYGFCGFVGE